MKNTLVWILALIITLSAAYYQRKTGPTYPKRVNVTLNDSVYGLKLIRSIGLDERPEVKLNIKDTSVRAILYYKRFRTEDEYSSTGFSYKVYPVHSFLMNKIFKVTEETGLFADVIQLPEAGKLQYYIELTDKEGTRAIMKESPVIIRFKGSVPGFVLLPHVLIMFIAMLFSTLTGLMSIFKIPGFKKYSLWTLILMIAGGLILGPIVQKFAFGDFWTGVPFGWDLTDNKTLIAVLFWLIAVIMNHKKERPVYIILAAVVLLVIFSIPHSLFGSELDYGTGQVIQGIIFTFSLVNKKNS
jgi:hypothetical protein